jgi:hypothetical protein
VSSLQALIVSSTSIPSDSQSEPAFVPWSQVFLQPDGDTVDIEGNPLPRLVYVSREKRPGYDHNKKAGAMNALIRASALITNAPFILNLDCDHYVNNCNAFREVRSVCLPAVPWTHMSVTALFNRSSTRFRSDVVQLKETGSLVCWKGSG